MKHNMSNPIESSIAQNHFQHLVLNGRLIELTEIKKTRTTLQNRSLHLFFDIISNELNNLGLEFTYTGIKRLTVSTRYTPEIVKEFIFKPIMKTLYKIDSTTGLTTQQINEISDVLIKFFGEKGIRILFPDIKTKLDKDGSIKEN